MSSKAYHRRIWHEMQHLIAVGVYHIGHWQNNRGQVRWFTEPQLIKILFWCKKKSKNLANSI